MKIQTIQSQALIVLDFCSSLADPLQAKNFLEVLAGTQALIPSPLAPKLVAAYINSLIVN